MGNITIKNISTANIILTAPNINFRRKLLPGRVIPLKKAEYEELSFDTGFSAMVREHYLLLSGVAEEEQVEVLKTEVFDAAMIEKMFDTNDITSFAKFLPTAAPAEKETVVKLAIDKRIVNQAFTTLIKKYCGVDVLAAINMQAQSE